MMASDAIVTHQLTRDFGQLRAIDNLTFSVARKKVFGFLGHNGAGKTTTIRLLLGLLEPTSGRAEVLGFDTRTQADQIRQKIGALLEHTGLYERLSAWDNLEYFGRIYRLRPLQRRARIQELLTHFGLWERRDDAAGSYSKGMRQKLAVARTLLHRPQLIFLDEPTSGLDPVAAAALHNDLATLVHHEDVTVFLTTHNLAEAEKLCQQIGIIRDGRLVAIGSPAELRARYGTPRLCISGNGFSNATLALLARHPDITHMEPRNGCLWFELRDDHADVAGLVTLAVQQGARIEEVRRDTASLEEAFLALMQEGS